MVSTKKVVGCKFSMGVTMRFTAVSNPVNGKCARLVLCSVLAL